MFDRSLLGTGIGLVAPIEVANAIQSISNVSLDNVFILYVFLEFE
jgi:hypothetical protein